jgi:2-keto-3-deoxy-L-rhamnonate aldolase RhmA
MPIFPNVALRTLNEGKIALGFGVTQSRTVAVASLARNAGYQWLAIDMEHGALSLDDTTQLCIAAASCGITPIVRNSIAALDEATRALDNGAQGILVPRVESASQARDIVAALRYPPTGRRSWGGGYAQFGAGPVGAAQTAAEAETLIIAMIESEAGIAAAPLIAQQAGIDALFIGMSDLTIELGIAGNYAHPRIEEAVTLIAQSCAQSGKILGMGGVYEETLMRKYLAMGVRLIAGGSDQAFMMAAAAERARLLRGFTG